jgi:hypothetical protein
VKRVLRTLAFCTATISLFACGGGGDSAAPAVASTSAFSVADAYTDNLKAVRNLNWTMSGIVTGVGVSGSGTFTDSGLAVATFGGLSNAQRKTIGFNGSISAQGQSAPYSQSESIFYDSAFRQIGYSGTQGVSYMSTTLGTLPTAAKVGDTGTLLTTTGYLDQAKTALNGTVSNVTWALSADTADTALLKLTSTSNGSSTPTSVETLRVTPSGTTSKVSIEANVNGNLLKFNF